MTYTKTILCLAYSRRSGGYCIAGKEVLEDGTFGSWVRPIFSEREHGLGRSAIRYDNGKLPKLLDYMEIPFVKPLPDGEDTEHQVENELIDPSKKWSCHGVADWQTVKNLYDEPDSLWGETDRVPELTAKNLKSSLMLIRPESSIKINIKLRQKLQTRAVFQYRSMHSYDFPVKDINYDVCKFSNYPEVVKIMDKYCLPVQPRGYVEKTKNGKHRVRFSFAEQFDKKQFEQLGHDENSKLILQQENCELSERKTDGTYAPGLLLKPSEITRALLCISLGGLFKPPKDENWYVYKLVAGIITPNMN